MSAIVIVGAPGAGKSTVGSLLAKKLQCEFIDTDRVIEARAGKSIQDIFVEQGEATFRDMERVTVRDALMHDGAVVSLGGGAIIDPRTREDLTEHTVVWLDVSLSSAASRVGLNTARPLLLGNVRTRLATLFKERSPLYAEVATITIDTDGKGAHEIVDDIVAELAGAS